MICYLKVVSSNPTRSSVLCVLGQSALFQAVSNHPSANGKLLDIFIWYQTEALLVASQKCYTCCSYYFWDILQLELVNCKENVKWKQFLLYILLAEAFKKKTKLHLLSFKCFSFAEIPIWYILHFTIIGHINTYPTICLECNYCHAKLNITHLL